MAASGTTRTHSLTGLDPATYKPHLLHDHSRTYLETNCYADIIIELLHACGYEPLAAFGHLVRMDFEGDQWTFFKPPPEDLEALFGIDIHEMQPYRPLPVQIAEQIELGRTMIVELDSWYLPDTASTSYRSEHVKTSCAFDAVDVEAQTLRYFHGAVLYDLEGDDYRGVFRIGDYSDDVLSPYTELVRFDAGRKLEGEALRVASLETLRYHLAKLPALLERGLEDFHAYAFATVRMAGSAFEVLATYAGWLLGAGAEETLAAMGEIVDGCKALSFRLARRRPFDAEPLVATLAGAWDRGMRSLVAAAG